MKADTDSDLFTDSEMNMFWEQMDKSEVKELQTEATDATTFSVNEYEIENVEIDRFSTQHGVEHYEESMELENCVNAEEIHQPVVDSEKDNHADQVTLTSADFHKQLEDGGNLGEHKLEDVDQNEENCSSIDTVADAQACVNDQEKETSNPSSGGRIAENSADVHQKFRNDGDLGKHKLEDINQNEDTRDSIETITDMQECVNNKGNETCKNPFSGGRIAENSINTDNLRSVLVHGTPKRRQLFMHDMKENTPAPKKLQRVNATAAKPSFRRKALEDIHSEF